ncbi:Mitochondrial genome maintenance exonuclease 1, partial [Armadillidium vulgare]
PYFALPNHALKSTSKSERFVITIKKNSSEKKKNIKHGQNLLNKELFGPTLKTAADRKIKKKPPKLPVADFHQDYSNISTHSSTLNDYENPTVSCDVNQIEHSSNLQYINMNYSLLINENTQFSKQGDKFPNNFNAINEKKSFSDKYRLPSVSKILQETMPPERRKILQKWEENMIMELGEEGFKSYKQGILDRGKLFHSYVEQSLQNKIEDDFQIVEQYIKSVKSVLEDIENVRLLESRVIHPYLHYQGFVDCVGLYRGNPVVIDFKTSAKPKSTLSSTYDSPLQVAAYLGAMNYDPSYETLPNISSALIVIAYETGMPAQVHCLSEKKCLKYWDFWCKRLLQFKNMNSEPR